MRTLRRWWLDVCTRATISALRAEAQPPTSLTAAIIFRAEASRLEAGLAARKAASL